ncbi:unnamed protein product, partial [Discosporangium mesarthrocarpum]
YASDRAEQLRNTYQEDIHYFVQHGSKLLKKLNKSRPQSHSSDQVKKLVQYVKEGHNALLYMNRCHDAGHVPSAASLLSLEHTLVRVHKASNALQIMIREHSRAQGQSYMQSPSSQPLQAQSRSFSGEVKFTPSARQPQVNNTLANLEPIPLPDGFAAGGVGGLVTHSAQVAAAPSV